MSEQDQKKLGAESVASTAPGDDPTALSQGDLELVAGGMAGLECAIYDPDKGITYTHSGYPASAE
jgi:hypothetical protein